MARFALKLGLFMLLVGITCLGVMVIAMWEKDDYTAALIDKHRLLESTTSPKIIVVGGSNAAFGLDSSLITRRMDLPVVNMGLHAATGLKYMLDEVKTHINEGDTVILSPEYDCYTGYLYGSHALWFAMWYYPRSIQHVTSVWQYTALARSLQEYLRQCGLLAYRRIVTPFKSRLFGLKARNDSVYLRCGFNGHGDHVAHLGHLPKLKLNLDRMRFRNYHERARSMVQGFGEYVRSRKAFLVLTWPSVPQPLHEVHELWFDGLVDWVSSLQHVTVTGTPRDFILPVDNFFDTEYHLTEEGRAKRTEKLLLLLGESLR